MYGSSVPAFEMALFFTAFGVVCVYLACVFALVHRLKSSRVAAKGYAAPDFFTFQGSFQLLGFLFSGQHLRLDDRLISGLVWGARVTLVIYLPLFIVLMSQFWMAA